jgi:hypothetical protein
MVAKGRSEGAARKNINKDDRRAASQCVLFPFSHPSASQLYPHAGAYPPAVGSAMGGCYSLRASADSACGSITCHGRGRCTGCTDRGRSTLGCSTRGHRSRGRRTRPGGGSPSCPCPPLPCCSGASSSWVSLSSMVLVRCFTCRSSFSCSVSPRRLRFSPVAGPLRSGSVRILRKAMLSVSVSIGGATCMWVAQWRTSRKHNGALLAGLPSLASLRLGRRTVPHLERTAGELRDQRTARSGAIRRSGVRSTNISNEIRHHAPHRPALRVIWGDGTSPQRCMAAASKTAAQASMEAGILPSSQMTHRRTGCARREVAANAVLFVHEEYMRSCQKHRTHISACCQCTCARQNITDRCKRTPFRLGCGAMGAW